jgi:acyl-CoA thioester hydrolase
LHKVIIAYGVPTAGPTANVDLMIKVGFSDHPVGNQLFGFILYNAGMKTCRYYRSISVRYGDLDPQGHVNNACYLTYLEQARIGYVQELDLWDGKCFQDVGIIIARVEIDYLTPILMENQLQVGATVSHLGSKSFDMMYSLEDPESKEVFAKAKTVLVSYDYISQSPREIPETWRAKIAEFEGIGSFTDEE